MKNLNSKTTSELVELFRQSSLVQDETYISDDNKKYKKMYSLIQSIAQELKDRPGDARSELLALLQDENPHVRLQAAKRAYPVAPIEARACLEAIRAARLPDQSLDAGMTLSFLERDPHSLELK